MGETDVQSPPLLLLLGMLETDVQSPPLHTVISPADQGSNQPPIGYKSEGMVMAWLPDLQYAHLYKPQVFEGIKGLGLKGHWD